MFDLGFTELLVIGVVALVVLGPERLPEVARAAGKYFAKAQGYVTQLKAEFNRETHLSEIQKIREEITSSAFFTNYQNIITTLIDSLTYRLKNDKKRHKIHSISQTDKIPQGKQNVCRRRKQTRKRTPRFRL